MNMAELIALASVRSGKSKGELAKKLGHKDQTRLSKLGVGALEPKASEIVVLAEDANLDPVKTLAEIEAQMHPEFQAIWNKIKETASSVREL